MFKALFPRATRAALIAIALTSVARADELPEITVTADRIEEPIGQTGASVTIIPGAEVAKLGTKGLADVLRGVAGLDVDEAGGVGAVTEVRLRGSNPGETLVLIDGVRIGDPSATDGSLDFGNLSAVDIERIEVLRGPQSALYGSDAMGGVINIITRKGGKTPHRTVTVEAGSYGTISTKATMSGGDDVWTYSLGVSALHADGFPRYGYRIDRPLTIGDGVTPLPPLPADDPTNKGGASGRFSYRVSDDVTVDAGFSLFGNALRFDNPYAMVASDVFSHYNVSQTTIADGFVRATANSFGGLLRSQLTVFANDTNSDIWEAEGCFDASYTAFNCRSGYQGARYGAEYQGDLKLGAFGALTFGARNETETASTSQSPNPDDGSFTPIRAQQITNSVFAEHRLALVRPPRRHARRADRRDRAGGRPSKRGARPRPIGSTRREPSCAPAVGTGDKAATLYQRFGQYGDPTLAPEQSFGVDAGVDQKLFDGRLDRVGDGFRHTLPQSHRLRRRPLVHADADQHRRRLLLQRRPRRHARRRTLGRGRSSFPTYGARGRATPISRRCDLETQTALLQRPRNKGALSLVYDGIAKLELEIAPHARRLAAGLRHDVRRDARALRQARFARQLQARRQFRAVRPDRERHRRALRGSV